MTVNPSSPAVIPESIDKAAAVLVGDFLKSKGIEYDDNAAIELVLAISKLLHERGPEDSIDTFPMAQHKASTKYSLAEFETKFKPIKNQINTNTEYDGYGFGTHGAEYAVVQEMLKKDALKVWTVINGEVSTWLVSGWHYVNRDFYVITENAAPQDSFIEIAYGHDESDKLYEVTVVNGVDESEEFKDSVYAESASYARERFADDISGEVSRILKEGGQPYVTVVQVV